MGSASAAQRWCDLHDAISCNDECMLQVLSPLQVARYLVASYPLGPDTLSLMNCLALQGAEPSTGQLLQTAARPGTVAGAARPGTSGGTPSRPRTAAAAVAGPGTAAAGGPSTGVPVCAAGDWRQALAQPLRVLHGRRQPSAD
jgi:hypothetical protein